MAALPHDFHDNFPQWQLQLLPQPHSAGSRETKRESCHRKSRASPLLSKKRPRQPAPSVAALLKRISLHPDAQRILGNSCIPIVILERLNFQPVVSLVRLPYRTQVEPRCDVSLHRPPENGSDQNEADIVEIQADSPESTPAGLYDLTEAETTSVSWTEPYSPGISTPAEPEQDSGFDCESHSDQPFILFDCGSDEWDLDGKMDSESFYLDPDPDPTVVIELNPQPHTDQTHTLELEDETGAKCVVLDVVQMEDGDEQRVCCSLQDEEEEDQADTSTRQPAAVELVEVTEEMESEDFCAVCLNGGYLLCCDHCPKVYHLACHIPPLISFPLGDWVCTLCRSDQESGQTYDSETKHASRGIKAPYSLSNQEQKRCEKLTLLLYCHRLSAPFHEPVSPLARNYYQIIKRPIDLSVIRRKLDKSKTLHYFSAEQFIDDVLLMFKNCATFNYPDSEVAQAGRTLEVFFFSKLQEIFPERTFPKTGQDRTDSSSIPWLNRRRKESYRRRRYAFGGKKYYL